MKKRIVAITLLLAAAMGATFFLFRDDAGKLKNKSGMLIESLENVYGQEEAPLKSGPETELPWASEQAFLDRQAETGAAVLLGAYRTVLKDPLPGEEFNVHLAARMLAGKTVKPGELFSQNGSIGPYTSEKGFQKGPTYIGTTLATTVGGGVCKIASTLYNVSVLSNLEIVERHAHSMPVPYVPYGQDATVAFGAKDFKFRNNTSSTLLIWAQGIDNVLYMGFYGAAPSPLIVWEHEVLETRTAPKNYKINPSLAGDAEKVLLEGMDGAVVKSWVHITDESGTKIKYMGVSDYRPMPYLIEKAE